MTNERRKQARERLRQRRQRARLLREQAEITAKIEQLQGHRPADPAPPLRATATTPGGDSEKQRRRTIDALERDVEELSRLTRPTPENSAELERLRDQVLELKREFYTNLGAWQRLQIARHPQRPYTGDYIRMLFENFSEIHGDRGFADDAALVTGMAWFHGTPVMIMGNQKGRDMKQRLARNFGQAKPEGYRKSLRAMELAAKFRRPLFVFVDTPGAY